MHDKTVKARYTLVDGIVGMSVLVQRDSDEEARSH